MNEFILFLIGLSWLVLVLFLFGLFAYQWGFHSEKGKLRARKFFKEEEKRATSNKR